MNDCELCLTPTTDEELFALTINERTMSVCRGCIEDAVTEMADQIEDARRAYCNKCPHFSDGGYCLQNLTPATCC